MVARLALLMARWSYRMHVTTDPMCLHYRAPRHLSHLDKVSRGVSCRRCGIRVRDVGMPGGPLTILTTTKSTLTATEADRIKQAWTAERASNADF